MLLLVAEIAIIRVFYINILFAPTKADNDRATAHQHQYQYIRMVIMKQLLTLEEHLTLSARINYLLAAKQSCPSEVLNKIIHNAELQGGSAKIAEDGIEFLQFAYQDRARRLGPLAVLHPLRTAHILVLATQQHAGTQQLAILDLLTAFLHDYYEDIYPHNSTDCDTLQQRLRQIEERLHPEQQEHLNYRLRTLTKNPTEQYHTYLGRLMKEARYCEEIIWVKMADRLDNTFDMRVVEDNVPEDSFRMIFDIIFLNKETRVFDYQRKSNTKQPMDEAQRLFQMFKNAVLLSIVRRSEFDRVNFPAQRLFQELALASIYESGRILMNIFNQDILDYKKQRQLIFEVVDYSAKGGLDHITSSQQGHRLDGLFQGRFDQPDKSKRKQVLQQFQQDKELMAVSALAFLSMFENFLSSPNYRIGGVGGSGFSEEDTLA